MKIHHLVFSLLIGSGVHAFTLTRGSQGPAATGYASSQVTFDMDVSCTNYADLVKTTVEAAAKVWGAVPNSTLKISLGEYIQLPSAITTYVGNSASQYVPQGNPIIYCDTSFASHSGLDANSIPGFATSQYLTSDGEIKTGLLVLNFQSGAQANVATMDFTIASVVLTHEIGHVIGIGHSSDTNALMYYATGAGRNNVLSKDDIDAVTYLYPSKEAPGGLSCGQVSSKNHTGWSNVIIELFLMLMALITIKALNQREMIPYKANEYVKG